ncbi:hypothetical protein ABK040_002276 [Willaertia magna]
MTNGNTVIKSPIHLYRIMLKMAKGKDTVYTNPKVKEYIGKKIKENFKDERNKDPTYQQLQFRRAINFLTISNK